MEKKNKTRPLKKPASLLRLINLAGNKFIEFYLVLKIKYLIISFQLFIKKKVYNFRFEEALEDFALRHETDLPLNSLIMMPIRMDYFFGKTFNNFFGNQIAMVPIKFGKNLSKELDRHVKSKGYKAVFLLSNLLIYLPTYFRNRLLEALKTRVSALVTLIDISKRPLFLDGKEILEIRAWSPTYQSQILASTYISYCNKITICTSK